MTVSNLSILSVTITCNGLYVPKKTATYSFAGTLPFRVALTRLAVGDHRITIAVIDEFDQNARNTTIITVPGKFKT